MNRQEVYTVSDVFLIITLPECSYQCGVVVHHHTTCSKVSDCNKVAANTNEETSTCRGLTAFYQRVVKDGDGKRVKGTINTGCTALSSESALLPGMQWSLAGSVTLLLDQGPLTTLMSLAKSTGNRVAK